MIVQMESATPGPSPKRSRDERYTVKAIVHAAQILAAFRDSGECLRLSDVVARTGFDKSTAFRLLYTLEKCRLVRKAGASQYCCLVRLDRGKRYTIGYASGGDRSLFDYEVTQGLNQAAEKENVELVVMDNRYSPKVAVRVVEQLVKQKVDLIIEYQTAHSVAPIIAAKCVAAGIPLIAVEIPHPGATYFGANNYEAGLLGGRYLAKWALENWAGSVDEIVLMQQNRAGPLPRSRLQGTLAGIVEVLPKLRGCPVAELDGDSDMGRSIAVVRNHLRFSASRRVLVGAIDDTSALGALRAFEGSGRASACAVLGQNAAPEARAEMRRPSSRLIGSVAYFPEKYGDHLTRLALEILTKKQVPPAVFVKHALITPANVGRFYPNDALMRYPL
jgi:ribose transport system substrate-binding protein